MRSEERFKNTRGSRETHEPGHTGHTDIAGSNSAVQIVAPAVASVVLTFTRILTQTNLTTISRYQYGENCALRLGQSTVNCRDYSHFPP